MAVASYCELSPVPSRAERLGAVPAQAKRLAEGAGGDLRSALETLQLLSAGAPAACAPAGGKGRKVRTLLKNTFPKSILLSRWSGMTKAR